MIQTTKINDILIVDVNIPRTSIYLANDFKDIIFRAIDEGEKYIVVNFSNCEFVDSTFLGVLVVSHKKLMPTGGSISLVITNPNIITSLEITRIDKIFKVFSTIDEASKNFEIANQ